MAPKSKDKRLRLGEPWATELAAIRAVIGLGNSEIGVVREAVRVFIAARTSKDKDVEAAYLAELERLNSVKRKPLRLVKPGETKT